MLNNKTEYQKSKNIETYKILQERQKKPLKWKIQASLQRINEWYEKQNGNVYVSFSGGKDSLVLLHLVRSIYPDVRAVFSNTGLEYPEIKRFVKKFENVIWIRPKKSFREVISIYGYPVVSKEQAKRIYEYKTTKSQKLRDSVWYGKDYGNGTQFKISEKWKFLVKAPFKISDKCCYYLKKQPFRQFEKNTKLKPYIGIMASDSSQRRQQIAQQGCNAFDLGMSRPLAFWTTNDIWDYIRQEKIEYCSIYDSGVDHTGCMFCMFGVHLQKRPNKFEIMRKTHPTQYKYCMEKLGVKKVLDYINVPY